MRLPKWPRWVWRCYAATFAGLAALVVCSFLPMWQVEQHVDLGDIVGVWVGSHTFWGMLDCEPSYRSDRSLVVWHWEKPAIITTIAVHIAAIVGAILGGVRWRKGEKTSPPVPLSASERERSTRKCSSTPKNAPES